MSSNQRVSIVQGFTPVPRGKIGFRQRVASCSVPIELSVRLLNSVPVAVVGVRYASGGF